MVDVTAHARFTDLSAVKEFQTVFSVICHVTKAIKDNRNAYMPIGNFQFISKNPKDNLFLSCDRLKELKEYMEVKSQLNVKEASPYAHTLSHCMELCDKNLPFIDASRGYRIRKQLQNPYIQFKNPFKPLIRSVDLTIIKKREKRFEKLSFTGKYIHNVVSDLCQFYFGVHFVINNEIVKIKELSIGKYIERLVFEQEIEYPVLINFPNRLLLVTQFGECDKALLPENVHDIVVKSVRQIAESDSVSLILRRTIQRAMALKKIEVESGCARSEQIIDEIIQLGTVAIGEHEMKKKITEIFTEYVKKIDFVFSNEKTLQYVNDFCDKIKEYIRSPLYIEHVQSTPKTIGLSSILGVFVFPHLLLASPMCVGTFAVGTTSTFLNNEQLTDSNYKNVLSFIVQELLEVQQQNLGATAKAEITDLIDQDNIFSN